MKPEELAFNFIMIIINFVILIVRVVRLEIRISKLEKANEKSTHERADIQDGKE